MEEEVKSVTIAALESALSHMQEANKRLAMITALSLILLAGVICGALYFLMNYEVVTTDVTLDSHEGPASYNYIGNDGDIDNGSN